MTMTSSRNGQSSKELVHGRIEAANENGIRVKGNWYNWSRYPGKTAEELGGAHLAGGDVVNMHVTGGRWICDIEDLASRPGSPRDPNSEPNGNWRHDYDGSGREQRQPKPIQPAAAEQKTSRLAELILLRLTQIENKVDELRSFHQGGPDYDDRDVPPEWPHYDA